MIYFIVKGSRLMKTSIMCKLYVSPLLPGPRVLLIVLLAATIVQSPDVVQVFGLLLILHCIGSMRLLL